jgi:antitoxin (DNA-binding transcriptional repressor) of toxin-antitoxin stability system
VASIPVRIFQFPSGNKIDHFFDHFTFPAMNTRQISISEFKAHCTEELRQVEMGNVVLQVTRHGKTIAVVGKPPEELIAPLLGAGKATATLNESYDPHAPAFDEEDWEMNH